MDLKTDAVKPEDRGVLGPCGIACLGCDLHTDESYEAAKTIVKIWEGFNLVDVGEVVGLEKEDVECTLKTLRAFIENKKAMGSCPGCYNGGKGHCESCPIVNCAKSKGYWTCAECEDIDPKSKTPCPYESSGAIFKLVCKRYDFHNLENLKRCREIGYPAFIAELKEKTENGWRTWQIISRESLFRP